MFRWNFYYFCKMGSGEPPIRTIGNQTAIYIIIKRSEIKIPSICFIVKMGYWYGILGGIFGAGSRPSQSFALTSLSARVRFIKIGFGLDPKTGEFAGLDLASQARHALENLKQVVVVAGYNLK